MKNYVNIPLLCLRYDELDAGLFTDKNLGHYGIGIRGDYFDQYNFEKALKKRR